MEIKQISVFLENTTGRLGEVTKTLARAGVNLRAICIADTAEFGILRVIVDKNEEALNALTAAGFTIKQNNVAAVEIDDVPGSLAGLMELFEKSRINIDYLYASLESKAGKAVVIFKIKNEDHDRGIQLLTENGLTQAGKF